MGSKEKQQIKSDISFLFLQLEAYSIATLEYFTRFSFLYIYIKHEQCYYFCLSNFFFFLHRGSKPVLFRKTKQWIKRRRVENKLTTSP